MRNLENFFNPKTIAIVGASDHSEKVGGILFRKALKSKCNIIPVNPKHDKLLGVKCYSKISEFKESIDLAVIAIPAPFVSAELEECGRKGIKNVILITAGFSEIGNISGEKQIFDLAKKYGINLLGSNCFGIFNPNLKLDLTFAATTPKKGKVALISQSGALWSYVSDFSAGLKGKSSFGFSGFVSLGNMTDLSFSDFIEYFSKDKATKSIVLYVERLKDGKKFIEICKKTKKKIYAVKAGSSEEGSKAAFSHTASLATDYEIYSGAFKQAGVVLCNSLLEAFEKASGKKIALSNKHKEKIGKKIFILTNAGGAGALLSDYLSAKGFELVSNENFKNPLDILGTASGSDYFNNLDKIKNMDFYDSIIVLLTPQSMTEIMKTAEVIANFKRLTGKEIVALFLGGKSVSKANKILKEENIPYFNTLEEARISLEPKF